MGAPCAWRDPGKWILALSFGQGGWGQPIILWSGGTKVLFWKKQVNFHQVPAKQRRRRAHLLWQEAGKSPVKCLLRSKASLATRTQTAPFPSPGVSVSATGTNIKNLGSPSNCSSPSLLQHLTSNPGVSSLLRTKEETFEALQPMRFPQQLNSAIAVWVCFIVLQSQARV